MDKAGKEQIVSSVTERYKQAAAVFLTEYRGLKVSEITQVRRELNKVDASLQVIKNRLTKRALSGEDLPELEELLKGPTALAFAGSDPVGTAKVLTKYAEEFEALKIRAGVMRGELIGPKQIEALSKLPSREEMYAKLLATLMAPITNVVRALNGVPTKVVRVLGAIKDTKE